MSSRQRPNARLGGSRTGERAAAGGESATRVVELRPPLRLAEPPDAAGGALRHLVEHARTELRQLDGQFTAALLEANSAESSEAIGAAFDEADALQRQLILASRRLRALEAEAGNLDETTVRDLGSHRSTPTPPEDAA